MPQLTPAYHRRPARRLAALLLILAALLAGCGRLAGPSIGVPQDESAPYRPAPPLTTPTSAPTSTTDIAAGSAPALAGGQAAPSGACSDNLSFVADITIPDGTQIAPESTLDKRWEVQNSGSCNWGAEYRVRLIAGPAMGAQEEQALFPARSGSRAMIRIVFKAPSEAGTYRSAWQAFGANGEPFGDPFFIDIVVEAP